MDCVTNKYCNISIKYWQTFSSRYLAKRSLYEIEEWPLVCPCLIFCRLRVGPEMMWFTQKGGALVCIKVPRNKHCIISQIGEYFFSLLLLIQNKSQELHFRLNLMLEASSFPLQALLSQTTSQAENTLKAHFLNDNTICS